MPHTDHTAPRWTHPHDRAIAAAERYKADAAAVAAAVAARTLPAHLDAKTIRMLAARRAVERADYGARYGIPARNPYAAGAPMSDLFGGQHDSGNETGARGYFPGADVGIVPTP